ncbi:MAG TPA: Uma2 family endonuclease [Polyangiaceae bacterium]
MSHTPGVPPSAAGAGFSWDDFVALDEDDLRELIDGELVEVEVPTFEHEHIVARLITSLTNWADAGHGGHAVASGYKVRISERRGVMPDVQFYRQGNVVPRAQQVGLSSGAPDLVVEIVSPSSRRYDRVTKLRWYASLGVPEYWILDPQARALECLVLRDGVYSIAASHADDETFAPESFEGLVIPLAQLWI